MYAFLRLRTNFPRRSSPRVSFDNTDYFKEVILKNYYMLFLILLVFTLIGCETVNEAGRTTGRVIGEGANTVGTITEGGAEAVQGSTTRAENPYGR